MQRPTSLAWRQIRIGAVAGLVLGMVVNGLVKLPMEAINQVVEEGVSLSSLTEQMQQGRYRVVMYCPVKNHRVTYHVQADQAGRAHMALEWVMPACALSGIAKARAAEQGRDWYRGEFFCDSNFYRKTLNVAAIDLQQVRALARTSSEGCRIETVEQTNCAFLNPLCERDVEDYRRDAELEAHRMLR
jgi:hypothetical protein